jgi:hypothetical protein
LNDLSRELLEYILAQPASWTKNKIDRPAVLQWMMDRKEGKFYYEVYWPRVVRMTERLKKWNWFPNLQFEIMETDQAEEVYWPCNECVAELISERIDETLEEIWENEYWAYEEPTEEEMLDLEVHPPMVRPRIIKGALQPSLF